MDDDEERKFDPVTPAAQNDIRPEFLGGNGGGGAGALGGGKTAGASAKAAEENATGGLYRPGGSAADEAKDKESAPGTGGLYNNGAGQKQATRLAALRGMMGRGRGGGKAGGGGAGGPSAKRGGRFAGKMPMVAGGAVVVVCVIGLLALTTPTLMIGALDYNLQNALGFTDTTAILEEQGEYVTADLLKEGAFGANYAERLAENGIEVGQVTAAGEFVRTNVYIAGLGEDAEVAANGDYRANGGGELVMKFKDQIVHASEFVAAVEATPEMYEAYRQGANISALYYYSEEVNDVYKEMNLSRNAFSSWKRTGDEAADQESFYQILNKMLDSVDSDLKAGDCEESEDGECVETKASGSDAGAIVGGVTDNTVRGNTAEATTRAAELLNSTISAGEPYKGVAAFLAIEEPLQQARIEGGGPVNETMNALMQETEVTYTDVNTGREVKTKKSLIGSQNFTAAASAGVYSKEEAVNFSRDRVFVATDTTGGANTKNSVVASNGQKKSNSAVGVLEDGEPADWGVMSRANNSVDIAVVQKNSELFQSTVGGNRAVEGGAFLSGTINQRALGSMPSDESTIMAYHKEVGEVLARQAEAERATKSPFDVTSPNTFLGSIVHNVASMAIRNWGSSGGNSMVTMASTVADMTGASVGSLLGDSAVADGSDGSYATTFGDYCVTPYEAGVEGDIYCTQDPTSYTGYMSRTKADWEGTGIGDSDGYEDFVTLGMEREVTVGVKSADVCKRWKEKYGGIITAIADFFASMMDMYQACGLPVGEVDEGISTGSGYALSDSNSGKADIEKYSAYGLWDATYSLLSEQASKTSQIKKEYYKENPKDESAAGIVARATGMTRAEAELALAYGTYLAMLDEYDASDRFAFGAPVVDAGEKILIEHTNKLGGELYAVWSGRAKYADVRNRSFAV